MKTSMGVTKSNTIYRLRRQINLEDNRGKLRVLVSQLQTALNQEPQDGPGKIHPQRAENPFDRVMLR
jgi:hypothetical protein